MSGENQQPEKRKEREEERMYGERLALPCLYPGPL